MVMHGSSREPAIMLNAIKAASISFIIVAAVNADQANGFGLPKGELASCSLTQPTVAIANGLNTPTLCETFASSADIDSSNTLASGYKWYTGAYGLGGPLQWLAPTDWAVSSNVLSLNNEQISGGFAFMSATTNQISPTVTTVGKTYAPPFYIQYSIAVNQALAPGSQASGNCNGTIENRVSWPTIWLNDVSLTKAQFSSGSLASNEAEIDVMEFYVGCPTGMGSGVWEPLSNIHIWNSATTILTSNTNNVTWGSGTWNGTTFHTVGELVTATNAYTYFDGTLMQTIPLTGSFSVTATGNYILIMNPGVSWPLKVGYVQVWQ